MPMSIFTVASNGCLSSDINGYQSVGLRLAGRDGRNVCLSPSTGDVRGSNHDIRGTCAGNHHCDSK